MRDIIFFFANKTYIGAFRGIFREGAETFLIPKLSRVYKSSIDEFDEKAVTCTVLYIEGLLQKITLKMLKYK